MPYTSPEFNAINRGGGPPGSKRPPLWAYKKAKHGQQASAKKQQRIPGGPRIQFDNNWGPGPPVGPNLTQPMYQDMSGNLPTAGALSSRFQAFGLPFVSPLGTGIVPHSTLRIPGPPDNYFDPGLAGIPGFGLGQSAWTLMQPGLPLEAVTRGSYSVATSGVSVRNLNPDVQVTQNPQTGNFIETLKAILKPKPRQRGQS